MPMLDDDQTPHAGFKVLYSRPPFFFEVRASTQEELFRKVAELDAETASWPICASKDQPNAPH